MLKDVSAVILAGGMGKRLRPLTEKMPKPMLPIKNTPVIGHIFALLATHGVRNAAVMCGYMAEQLEEMGGSYGDLKISYVVEDTPLGTAGCVREALVEKKKRSKLDVGEDFLVMCGDAYCDVDLSAAYEFHRSCGGLLTMVVTQVENPQEYGLVQLDEEGRVLSFTEKPDWSAVHGDIANTGIYFCRREILDYIPEGVSDFGRDLFVCLLAEGQDLYGYVTEDFWCDIGDAESYYSCNMRASGGDSIIGAGSKIADSSGLGSSVIGKNVKIGEDCVVLDSIVWNNCIIGRGAVIEPRCIIGDGCVISENVTIKSGSVMECDRVTVSRTTHSVGQQQYNDIFHERTIIIPADEAEEVCYRLGLAIGNVLKGNFTVGLMYKSGIPRGKEDLIAGLVRSGGTLTDEGEGFEAIAAFAARERGYNLMIFASDMGHGVELQVFDLTGLYPGVRFERDVQSALRTQKILARPSEVAVQTAEDVGALYVQRLVEEICRSSGAGIPLAGMEVGLVDTLPTRMLARALSECGAMLAPMGEIQVALTPCGTEMMMQCGELRYEDWQLLAPILRDEIEKDVSQIALPYRAPKAMSEFVESLGGKVAHYTLSPSGNEAEARAFAAKQPWLHDGCFALGRVLALIACREGGMAELMQGIPAFGYVVETVDVAECDKMAVIKSGGDFAGEGVSHEYDGGRVRMIANSRRGVCLVAEAGDMADATELIRMAKERIESMGISRRKKETQRER